ncbi:PAS domain-containing protein [Streptomyces sp. 549]|uniref:PAS domain-containing protein n=1 Tax=Streptomyces sp. 549 TaxID=3049076 RepID=UPI0024C34804|nr:PAS domain-containing protein [Streptomyces sp. 549]MDK1472119.1 PAS domain-containing protein [Streptomyces sp. 549]
MADSKETSVESAGGSRSRSADHELLRAVFQRFPLPVVLLDRDAVVRRLNEAAAGLFGMREGYASGRGLTGALAHAERAAFRSQVAAVARDEGGRSLTVRLLRPPGPRHWAGLELRTTLTPLRPPREPHVSVVAVFQQGSSASPEGRAPVPSRAASPAADTAGSITRHTEMMDVVDDMTAALLSAPSADGVVDSAGAVLHPALADWVIVDLAAQPGGREQDSAGRRAVFTGGGHEELRRAVASMRPEDSPVVETAMRKGAETLQAHPENADVLGRTADGTPLLERADVSSLLCVPLRAGREAPVIGALTLLRCGARRPFELAEAGAVDRIARHVVLALDGR